MHLSFHPLFGLPCSDSLNVLLGFMSRAQLLAALSSTFGAGGDGSGLD
jgi:hypothetical protein